MTPLVQFTVSGLAAGGLYAMVALGLALLYQGTRVLSFAHGAYATLAAYVFWDLYPAHAALPVALPTALAVAVAAGIVTERLVIRPLGPSLLTAVVATLAVGDMLTFAVVKVWGTGTRTVAPLVTRPTVIVGRIILPAHRLLILAVAAGVAAAMSLLLRRSRFGLAVRAAAEDPVALRLRGVSPTAMATFAWAASAGLSGLAGILVTPILGLGPFVMTLVLIRAFTGALLGGLTSLGGAMAGGLLVGVVESHLQSRTSYPGAVEAALFAVIVAVLLLRPHGLFGRPEPVRPAPFAGGGRRLPRPRPLAGLAARRRALLGAGLVGTATVAAAASGEYWSFVAAVAATYAVVGISMFLLSGLAGQLSLGHAALMGLGGFTAALLTSRAGWPYPVTIPAAALVAAVGAAAIGVPAFRIRGLYLAVATLAFGIAAERWLFRLTAVSGGSEGVGLPPMSARSLLGLSVLLLAGAAVLARRVAATRGGSNLRVLHH